MKTKIEDPSFAQFLAAWLEAGSPQYMDADHSKGEWGTYLNAPVHSSNHARISKEGLPADIVARFPKAEANGVHTNAIVGPSWTRVHGIVLDVSFSGYSNGWCLFAVATYLPNEGRWVHPTEVHTYGYPES